MLKQNEYCISVRNLYQSYGAAHALNGISFNVKYGEVIGFLGPNGAGKTTTINVLTTLIRPSSGSVKIFGIDTVKDSLQIRKRIGVVFQESIHEKNVTVESELDLYGFMWGLASDKRHIKLRELLARFHLEGLRAKKIVDLSIGEKRRVQVARQLDM